MFYKIFYNLSIRLNAILGFNAGAIPHSMLLKILKDLKNPTVIDVGCNIGEFSDSVYKINHRSNIYAFDLHADLETTLRKKFVDFKFFFECVAVSDKKGTGKIKSKKKFDRKAYLAGNMGTLKTRVDTLDNLLKNYKISKIEIIKIDTEGNDYKVLLGSKNTLRVTEIIIFQIMYRLLENGTKPNEVINFLKHNRFKYFYRATKYFGLVPILEISPYEITTQNIVASKKRIF